MRVFAAPLLTGPAGIGPTEQMILTVLNQYFMDHMDRWMFVNDSSEVRSTG